jgi:hypothetical protein
MWLRSEGHRTGRAPNANDGLGPRGLLAWDMVRLIAVAGWGFVADYISEAEAWSYIGPAAVQLKQAYQSWEDLGRAYAGGAAAWDAGAEPACNEKLHQLLNDPQSPWRNVAWNVDLGTWNASSVNLSAGTVDLGGGAHLKVKINGMTPEGYVKDKISQTLWGWAIGGFILLVMALGIGGTILYVMHSAETSGVTTTSATAAAAAKWDGKSPLECGGNDVVAVSGVTATLGGTASKAGGNCQLTLTDVNITAPIGIEASGNAKVTVSGGSITSSSNSIVAGAASHVTCSGTKVTGKAKATAAAKITGAN